MLFEKERRSMQAQPRTELTEDENQRLAEMELSFNARAAVEKVWKNWPKPPSKTEVKELSNQLRFLIPINPLMVLVLGANLLYNSPILSKLSVFAAVMAWVFYVFLYSLGIFCSSVVILLEFFHPLSPVGIGIWQRKTGIKAKLKSLYNDVLIVSIIVLLAANGYGITAAVVCAVYLVGTLLTSLARNKVNNALLEAESKPAV